MVKRLEWTPELVGKFWNGVAQTRLDELSFGRAAGPAFLDIVDPFLRPNGRHLDFGAGSGHIIRLLIDRGYAAAGFDPAPDRQAALLDRVGVHPKFLGAVGPGSGEQFDVVLLIEVIEHVLESDLRAVLARINQFVVPGGRVIVSTPNDENLELANVYCPVSDTLFHPWQHVRSFTPVSLARLLAEFGFERAFLGLTDFSADAAAYDRYRQVEAQERLLADFKRTHAAEAASLAATLAKQREVVAAAVRTKIDAATEALSWNRKKGLAAKLHFLHQYRRTHAEVVDLLASVAGVCADIEQRLEQALATLAPEVTSAKAAPRLSEGGYDLRQGRESTIVFVGRKVRNASAA